MIGYYLATECDTCGGDMFFGLVADASGETHNGHPVIRCDMVSQIQFDCDCGGVTYTGDFGDMTHHEAGQPEDDEDDDPPAEATP